MARLGLVLLKLHNTDTITLASDSITFLQFSINYDSTASQCFCKTGPKEQWFWILSSHWQMVCNKQLHITSVRRGPGSGESYQSKDGCMEFCSVYFCFIPVLHSCHGYYKYLMVCWQLYEPICPEDVICKSRQMVFWSVLLFHFFQMDCGVTDLVIMFS